MTIDKTVLRDAATVIMLRNRAEKPSILMGQRGAAAAFMPRKFVFPGGAVDGTDALVPLAAPMGALCRARLAEGCPPMLDHALAAAAIRELWEETGFVLGRRGDWPGPPPQDWRGFAATGHVPSAEALQFVFRAITPPGRPRRFDARFFLAEAGRLCTDPDDFGAATDELGHLHWVPLDKARGYDLPFVTEIVLAEIAARLDDSGPPPSVPFFRNDDEVQAIARLGLRGRSE